MTQQKTPSLLLVLLAYLAAFAAAVLIARIGEAAGYGSLISGLSADIGATLVIFVFSMLYRNSSTYDAYWSVAPPVLFLYWAYKSSGDGSSFRTTLVLAVTLLWAIRLTSNWMRDWPGMGHEDWRYREFRDKFGKAFPAVSLGAIHMFPTLIVALASVPAWMAMQAGRAPGIWDILGVVFCVGGAVAGGLWTGLGVGICDFWYSGADAE